MGRKSKPEYFRRPQRQSRTPKRRFLICVEGEKTEKQYFELLKQYLRTQGTTSDVKVIKPKGTDPASILKGCLDYLQNSGQEYDECFCVVDVDEHATLDAALHDAKHHDISMVVTNLKFEVWLLWHLGEIPSGYTDNRSLDTLIKKASENTETPLFQGRNLKNLHPRFPLENYQQAVSIAKRRDPKMAFNRKGKNPSSAMPLLIDKLT